MNTLTGRTILLTRPDIREDALVDYLKSKGALVFNFPLTEIRAAGMDDARLDILRDVNACQWIIFTSRNGVTYFFDALEKTAPDLVLSSSLKFAVIGEKTAEALSVKGFHPDFISKGNNAREFLEELKTLFTAREKILLAQGNLADNTLADGLAGHARVSRINVYDTQSTRAFADDMKKHLEENRYDLILFYSPSAVKSFVAVAEELGITHTVRAACIGTTTEKALNEAGIDSLLTSGTPSGKTFAIAIENYLLK